MSGQVLRRSKRNEQENQGLSRPKSLHYDGRSTELSKSLSSLHSMFNSTYDEKGTAINGEKALANQGSVFSDPTSTKREKKGSFRSRFLRSKTDTNIVFNPSKGDSERSFKSRFLRRNDGEGDSSYEDGGRKAFRSKYLNKKYNDQLRRIQQYASTRTLDRYDQEPSNSPSWKAYLDSKALKSNNGDPRSSTDHRERSMSPHEVRKYDFSTKLYSSNDASTIIGSPRSRRSHDSSLSSYDSSYRNSRMTSQIGRADYSISRSRDNYSGSSSKPSLSGTISPRDGFKSGAESGAMITRDHDWYSSATRSAIADMANDFRPTRQNNLLPPTSSTSPSPDDVSVDGRLSPTANKSSRRPSTILRRPRNPANQPGPKGKIGIEDHGSRETSPNSINITGNTSENKAGTTNGNELGWFQNESINHESESSSRSTTFHASAQSGFLGRGVSTPDLSRPEEGELTEAMREERKKEVEEARRQWRKERARTVEKEEEQSPKSSTKRSVFDTDVALRKPKALYPIDDGLDSLEMNTKTDDRTTNGIENGRGNNEEQQNDEAESAIRRWERRERKKQSKEPSMDESCKTNDENADEMPVEEPSADISKRRVNQLAEVAFPEKERTFDQDQSSGKGTPSTIRKESKDVDPQAGEKTELGHDNKCAKSEKGNKEEPRNNAHSDSKEGEGNEKQKSSTVVRRKKGTNEASKSRARPSSLYYYDDATIHEESSSTSSTNLSAVAKPTDSEPESHARSAESMRPDIPKIVRRGPSESTDDEHCSHNRRILGSTEPSTKNLGVNSPEKPQAVQRRPKKLEMSRPLSLFFLPHDLDDVDGEVKSSIFASGTWETASSAGNFVTDVPRKDRQVNGDSSTVCKGIDRGERPIYRDSERKNSEGKESKAETTGNEDLRKGRGRSSRSQERSPRRTSESKTEAKEETGKDGNKAGDQLFKRRGSTGKAMEVEKGSSLREKRQYHKRPEERSYRDRKIAMKGEEYSSSSDTDVPKYKPIRTIDLTGILTSSDDEKVARKPKFDLSPFSTRKTIRRPRFGASTKWYDEEVPIYKPIRTIDLSGLLTSSDEEREKTKQRNKEEEQEHAKTEGGVMQGLDRKYTSGKLKDPPGEDFEFSRYQTNKSKFSTSTILRNTRRTYERPKSFHFGTFSSDLDDVYNPVETKAANLVPDKFTSELDSFRKEIDRLLNRADDVKNRSELLGSKTSSLTRSYRELQTKVTDVKEESISTKADRDALQHQLILSDFDFPNTEEEWERFFKMGVLIKKAVERIERQKYLPYEPWYYSEGSSYCSSVEDRYDLLPGTSYFRDRRAFDNSYIGCNIPGRKVSESDNMQSWHSSPRSEGYSDSYGESYCTNKRDNLSSPFSGNSKTLTLDSMSFAPETTL